MKNLNVLVSVSFVAITMSFFSQSISADVETGQPAPVFELIDQYSKPRKLADHRGQWVVLYFYPKDDTPGCTKEACNFRDDILQIRELGAEVLGVSLDDSESHAGFAEKYGLPFPLLSDPKGKVAEQYGSLWSLGPIKVAKRHSFIIDPEGRVVKIYRKVKPEVHSKEVINDLRELVSKNR